MTTNGSGQAECHEEGKASAADCPGTPVNSFVVGSCATRSVSAPRGMVTAEAVLAYEAILRLDHPRTRPWLRRQSTGAEHRPSFTARSCRGPVVPSGRFEAQPTVGPLGLAATGGPTQPTDDSSDLLTPDQGPAAAAAQEEHPHAHATTPRPRLPPRDPYDAGRADPSQPGPRHLPRLQRPDRLRRRHHRPAVSSAAWTRTVRRAWTPGPQCWVSGPRVLCSRTAFFCALSRWAWVLAVVSPRMR